MFIFEKRVTSWIRETNDLDISRFNRAYLNKFIYLYVVNRTRGGSSFQNEMRPFELRSKAFNGLARCLLKIYDIDNFYQFCIIFREAPCLRFMKYIVNRFIYLCVVNISCVYECNYYFEKLSNFKGLFSLRFLFLNGREIYTKINNTFLYIIHGGTFIINICCSECALFVDLKNHRL